MYIASRNEKRERIILCVMYYDYCNKNAKLGGRIINVKIMFCWKENKEKHNEK